MRRAPIYAAALLILALVLPARADAPGTEEERFWEEQQEWTCGGRIEITQRLLKMAALEPDELSGYGGDGSLPPFLVLPIATSSRGVVIAVQQPSGWVGFALDRGHDVQGAYIVRRGGRALFFTMHTVEGPGHDYQILRTDDGFASVACSSLEFPPEVESPDSYIELIDFNVDARGSGRLIGHAEEVWPDARAMQERSYEERSSYGYEYRTADGARTWSPATRIPREPSRLSGIYGPLEQGAPLRTLHADLERAAK